MDHLASSNYHQISELREHLDQIPTSSHAKDDFQPDVPGPDLLFGRQRHATKQELLAALPLRSELDQLIGTYFASMDTAPSKQSPLSGEQHIDRHSVAAQAYFHARGQSVSLFIESY